MLFTRIWRVLFVCPWLLQRMEQMEQALAELKVSLDAYVTAVDARSEQGKANTAKAVADAIAEHDRANAVIVTGLKQQLDEAYARFAAFQPSNN